VHIPDPPDNHDGIRENIAPQIIAEPLRTDLQRDPVKSFQVIIELNLDYPGGVDGVRSRVREIVMQAEPKAGDRTLARNLEGAQHPYLFAELTSSEVYAILEIDGAAARAAAGPQRRPQRAIFKIWESTVIRPLTTVSIRTVKVDAAQRAYSADGRRIVWAVLDSGIDGQHPHFGDATFNNLTLPESLQHKNFVDDTSPLVDDYGHGTHVAGIIAGKGTANPVRKPKAAIISVSDDGTSGALEVRDVPEICGMAPACGLLSLKVLKADGTGDVTAVINALEYIIQANKYGQHILVQGANISAGYLPDVRWYGVGQTPVCRQVNRAVKSGICVVVAAGNTGYVVNDVVTEGPGTTRFYAGQLSSINDPGNAELAVTVGSTHREKPHVFGISYFSSKGPTADGRRKPDVVAPGERIISCASGALKARKTRALQGADPASFDYVEDSGTSMAAPHVSGVLAAFLSVRREFIGRPEDLTALLVSSAMDLKREVLLQGAGLVDLMKLLASV
jgi:subtilisin family serine protease